MRLPTGPRRTWRALLTLILLLPLIGGLLATAGPFATPVGALTGPAGLPDHFGIGVSAQPDATGIYGWMPDSGIPWDYAYQYLAGGVNTGGGWETWNEKAQFPLWYAQGASQHGYVPVLTYYDLLHSNGTCNGCGETEKDLSNLNNPTTMAAYYANFALLMKRLGPGTYDTVQGFGGTAIVHVEPDLSGYAQQAVLDNDSCYNHCTGQGNNPALLGAAVASSGASEVANYPNNYQGFNWALLHLRDLYAPNVLLAVHLSNWATGPDIGSDHSTNLDIPALGAQAGQFAALSGMTTAPTGTAKYDLLFNDVADRDAGYYKYAAQPPRDVFWDRLNVAVPHFHRWEDYLGAAIVAAGSKPAFVWQIPLGNQYSRSVNSTDGHYQDNRAEYFFGHIAELASIGIVGLLFGAGNAGSTVNFDGKSDGVTNPTTICTTDGLSSGQICTLQRSTVADDDGGYLRMAATQFYAPSNPSPSPSPTVTYTLALTAGPGGTVSAAPSGGTYPTGTKVTITATPNASFVFTGWTVDGSAAGWASPATLTMNRNRVVTATFAAVPPFPDLPPDQAMAEAVRQLAARGIIKGYEDGSFGPDDQTLRAQMAALIVRAMGWQAGNQSVPFTDRGPVDDALWQAVGTLAARGVARGYPDGTYDPTGPVLHIQTIAFIARAMVAQGWWAAQPDDPALYPNIPATSGHRGDIATWVRYAGALPGTTVTGADWSAWDMPSTRAWFALALWTALDNHFRIEQLP